jgi:hypothetical protein
MTRNASQDAVRAAKQHARLGEAAVCVVCGYANEDALRLVARSVVEKHHVVGRVHEADVVVPLCANCHVTLTEAVRRSGADMKDIPNLLDRLISMLRAIGTFLKTMGDAALRWADQLSRLVLGLDVHYPEWRAELTRP